FAGSTRSPCFGLNARPLRKFGPRICHPEFSAGTACIDDPRNVGSSCSAHTKREVKKPWHKGREPVYMTGRWGFASTTKVGNQEIDGMARKLAVAFGVIGLTAGALVYGAPARAQGVKAGVLTCNVASGFGFIFGSSKAVNCNFAPVSGPPQHYTGSIDRFGV